MTELFENIDMRLLTQLNRMGLGDYMKFADKKQYKPCEIKEHFQYIKEYLKSHIKCGGKMKKLYKYSEQSQNGRLYGVNSIQNLDGIIRGFLFRHTTTDIDMQNAHPRILEYICRIRNIRCPHLSEYINNRDLILDKLVMVGVENPKMVILKLLNTEKMVRLPTDCEDILKNLRNEFKTIRGELKKQEDFTEQLQQAMTHKPKNVEGSFVNRILCIYENQILQSMASYVHQHDMEIAEYAYDGLLVYGNLYQDIDFLNHMQNHVNHEFKDLNMVLTYKPHSNVITEDYLNSLEDTFDIDENETYDGMKKEFEKIHFKIINKSFFIKLYGCKTIFMKKANIIDSYEHMVYLEEDDEGKVISKSFITKWLKDPELRAFTDIECYPPPLQCPPHIYNLWTPFSMELVTEYEEKDISILLNHIKIMCNHEDDVYDYFIKWLAQMVQYPAVKTKMVLFQGDEGCGKGTLFKMIEKMIGSDKYLETTSPDRDVWGSFNGLMTNTFFVYLNELSKKQALEAENKLKGYITDGPMQINTKGKDAVDITSYHRWGSSYNPEEGGINTHKGDRRKLMVAASNELIGNFDYFDEINECISDVNYIKSLYEYLKNIPDMDKFNSIKIPMTEYQKNISLLSTCPIENFIKSMIEETEEQEEIIMDTKTLFHAFHAYLTETKTKYEINLVKFGVRLTNLKLKGVTTIKKNYGNCRRLDVPILKGLFGIGCLI